MSTSIHLSRGQYSGSSPSRKAFSEIGSKIADRHEKVETANSASVFLNKFRDECDRQLKAVRQDFADIVPEATFANAARFLGSLPKTLPTPWITADPDGEISIEWLGLPGSRLSVTVNESNAWCYAVIEPGHFAYGQDRYESHLAKDSIVPKIFSLTHAIVR